MIYRNRKLLDLAHRVHHCMFKLPGCKGYVVEGCEPVHSDRQRHGKGGGIKAGDDQHVAGCHHCHEAYTKLPKEEKLEKFEEARVRTFLNYEAQGWLKEVGYDQAK